jgi:hypothetical protein
VRRLVALLVIALLGATVFGFSSISSGINVNGATLSGKTFRSELAVISTTPTVQCYITALDPVSFAAGAGGATIAATGAAAWANLRVEGIAISQYVAEHFRYHASAAALASARASLEGEMTQAAASNQLSCPGTSAQALADMPTEMRNAEIQAQATSLYLVSKLNSTIPLTTASMKTYYGAHASDYDTLCVSLALVAPTRTSAFAAAQAGGASVATLAKEFSVDASAAKGGAYGCYGPSNSSYSSVRGDVGATALNTFPTTPQYISSNGSTFALYVAPTKRSPTPFAEAATAVLVDLQNINANSANTVKENILYQAAIAVDPAFGRWGLKTTGPSVFAPATPVATDVNSPTTLTSPRVTAYK